MRKILRARPRFKVAVALLMTMVVSVSALAASPFQAFQAEAVITGIDTGTVKAAGPLRWNVKDRTVSGTFTDGSLSGPFTLTYDANVFLDQSGKFNGTLRVEDYEARISGDSAAAVALGVLPLTPDFDLEYPETWLGVVVLDVQGRMTFIRGVRGNGTFNGSIIVLATHDGHVESIAPAGMTYFTDHGPAFIEASTISVHGNWRP